MKKIILILLTIVICGSNLSVAKKKYKFTFTPPFDIEQVRVAEKGTKFVKSWAVDKNADKAIIKAKQNVVAAALFTGIAPNNVMGCGAVPPLCPEGPDAYMAHKDYFDKIFVEGEFFNYAIDVNSTYPTGQNNIQTPEGRRVGVMIQLLYDELRERLIQDNIIKSMGSQFNF